MARKINKKKVNKVEVIEEKPKVSRQPKFETRIDFYPRTEKQKEMAALVETNDIVFAIGPAGGGKTHVSVAMALMALHENKANRLIITRPAVEAGEKIGYLPGDIESKLAGFLTPIYDVIDKMIGIKARKYYIDNGVIQILPLAFVRGLTFENSIVILSEAQNCTPSQCKMFLTRIGKRSKVIVEGDPSQTDLPYWQPSGLQMTVDKLQGIEGIATVEFSEADIIRHRLVKEIVKRLVDDPPTE